MTTVTLTSNVPTALADSLGLASGAGRQTGAVLDLADTDAQTLVTQGLASFGSAASDAGTSGTQGRNRLRRGTATLDFPSIAAGATAALTIPLDSADVGDPVVAGPPANLAAGLVPVAFVSAANVVTVRLTNTTGAAIDPAAASWTVVVVD